MAKSAAKLVVVGDDAVVPHVQKRLRRPNADQSMQLLAMVMATTQLAISMAPDAGDPQREFIHELFDFAWIASHAQMTAGALQ